MAKDRPDAIAWTCIAVVVVAFAVPAANGHGQGIEHYRSATIVWQIGDTLGSDNYTFGRIGQVSVSGTGDVFVLDRMLRRVQIYAKDGRYKNTVGGPGLGPGEFSRPQEMAVSTAGEVIVRDGGKAIFAKFNSAGKLLESRRAWKISGYMSGPLHVDRNNNIYYGRIPLNAGDTITVFRWTRKLSAAPDTFRYPAVLPRLIILTANEGRFQATLQQPFSPSLFWTVTSSGQVVLADGATGRVSLWSEDTSVRERRFQRKVRIPDYIRDSTETALGQRLSHMMKRAGGSQDASPPEMDIPERYPAILGVWSDPDGRIWVRAPSEREEEAFHFLVLSSQLDLLCKVSIERGKLVENIWAFTGNVMYAVRQDELGVQSVVMLRWGKNAANGCQMR